MTIFEQNKNQDVAAELVFAEGARRRNTSLLGSGFSAIAPGLQLGSLASLFERDSSSDNISPRTPTGLFAPPSTQPFRFDFSPVLMLSPPETASLSAEAQGITVVPVGIPGGLIFDPPIASDFSVVGDTDTFFIDVDPGQKLTVVFLPEDPAIQGQINLFDPGGLSLGTGAAIAPGESLLLQNLPGTGTLSGTYQLDATSLAGTGNYTVEFILNSSVETESITGLTNDTIATAQNIDSSAIGLVNGADRLAVLGETGAGIIDTVISDLGFSGTSNNAHALTYDSAQAQFLLLDRNQNLHSLAATGGAATLINTIDHDSKGLAFLGADLYSIVSNNPELRQIDPTTGQTLNTVALQLANQTIIGGNGLATHPQTGELWAIVRLNNQTGRELITIDPTNGQVTRIGNTSDNFAAIAFDTQGILYGSTGSGGTVPESIFTLSTADGTTTLIRGGLDEAGGEALAFNPTDGQLYRASGTNTLQTLEVLFRADLAGDVFAFTLNQDQPTTLVASSSINGPVRLELLDDQGNLLALGSTEPQNADGAIADFVAPTTGTYYARIATDASADLADYSLVLTRGASFDLEFQGEDTAQDIGRTGVVLGSTGAAGSGSTGSSGTTNLGVTLFDGNNFRWDLQGDGEVNDGSSDAFDGGFELVGFPNFSSGDTEENGREIVFGPQTDGDVQITRKVFVPSDDGFARFVDSFTNTGATPITRTVSFDTNLGSDGSETILGTSSGDLLLTAADYWLVTDDSNATAGDPAIAHIIAGATGLRPTSFTQPSGSVQWSFELVIQPGETQSLLSFGVQDFDRQTVLAKAAAIERLEGNILAGLTTAEANSIVNWQLPSEDLYRFNVTTATTLTLTTTTPGDGPNEPDNLLDPRLALFFEDGSGTPLAVAVDENSAADGRNAIITYAVPANQVGTYFVEVDGASGGGTYLLTVDSSVPGAVTSLPFGVAGSDLVAGASLNTFPDAVRLELSDEVAIATLAAADFTLTDPSNTVTPANAFTVIDGNTLSIDLAGLATGDGTYTLNINGGAFADVSGDTINAFSLNFNVDTTAPQVTTTRINGMVHTGAVLQSGSISFEFELSEALAELDLGPEDVRLTEAISGTVFAPDTVTVDGVNSPPTVAVDYANLPEGEYRLDLVSSTNAFRDLADNPLDGDGNGTGGDNFSLAFSVDAAVPTEIPTPLQAIQPAGSLIYAAQTSGIFHGTGDADDFTVDLDAGQTLTVILDPNALADIQGRLEVFDPTNTSLAIATAATVGETVLLQTAPVTTAGTYRIDATSLVGTGRYAIEVVTNAAIETEGLTTTVGSNDDGAGAQNIDGASVALPNGGDRLAVAGGLGVGAAATATNLGLSGLSNNANALTFASASQQFLLADRNENLYLLAETGGAAALIGRLDHLSKGLAFVGNDLYSIDGSNDTLYRIDPTTAETLSSVTLQEPGETITRGNGLATHPITGELWAILQASNTNGRILATIDPATGQVTRVGDTGDNFAAIAFDSNGTLFGGTGNGANVSEALFILSPLDGTPTLVEQNLTNGGGEALAFNPTEQQLYRASGFTTFETLQVVLRNDPGGDLFSFTLNQGQAATLAVATAETANGLPDNPDFPEQTIPIGIQGEAGPMTANLVEAMNNGPVTVELLDDNGTVLAVGIVEEGGLEGAIADFVAPSTGTYFARITGTELSDYSLVVTRDATFNLLANDQLAPAQDIGLTGVLLGDGGNGPRFYQFETVAGNTLTLTTTTPGGGLNQPDNGFDPQLELLFDDGVNPPVSVALDDDSAVDGRNALINYTVPVGQGGTYIVNLFGTGTGDVTLSVNGTITNGITAAPFAVTSVEPLTGTIFAAAPNTYRVHFADGLLLDSIDATDLSITDPLNTVVSATGVTVVDGNTLEFELPNLTNADGIYTLNLAAGVLTNLAGAALDAFTSTFVVDATNPTVQGVAANGTAIAAGDVLPIGPTTFTIALSEILDPLNVGPEDVVLTELTTGTVVPTTALTLTGSTLTVEYADLLEGSYSLSLASNTTAFRDVVGNLLDGDGDGTAGDNFVFNFATDATMAAALPVLTPALSGSLIFETTTSGFLDSSSDTDTFTLDLDAGQLLTLALESTGNTAFQGELELFDPTGASLGIATASALGDSIFLQTRPAATAGTYQIDVGATAGSGTFTLQTILNGALEAESLTGLPNDTLANAQDLSGTALAIGSGDRQAVVGTADTTGDVYAFTLNQGQVATLAIASTGGGPATLELLDSIGNPVAVGTTTQSNVDEAIANFVAPTSGNYYARVTSTTAAVDYNLVVLRDTAFNLSPNQSFARAQDIGLTSLVLGTLNGGGAGGGGELFSAIATANNLFSPNVVDISFSNLPTPGGEVTLFIDATSDLNSGSENVAFDAEGILQQTLFINGAQSSPSPQEQVTLTAEQFQQLIADDGTATFTFTPTSQVGSFGGGFLQVRLEYPLGNNFYRFAASEGNTLTLSTTTPGDGPNQPANGLDPRVELFFDDGINPPISVAMDENGGADGRNALLSYTVPVGQGGEYIAVLEGENSGAFVLEVQGADNTGTIPFEVTNQDIADGTIFTVLPTTYTIDLSEGVLLGTVAASDLTIVQPSGGMVSATNVTVVDGDTLTFDFSSGGDGLYTFQLGAGSLTSVSGQANAAFTSTLILDASSPSVTALTANGTSLVSGDTIATTPTTTFNIQFSETLAETGLGVEDVLLTDTISGASFTADLFNYTALGSTLTLDYTGLPEGDYTLTLLEGGTAFRDLVDNPLAPFSTSFSLDTVTAALPVPFTGIDPAGSLIYDAVQTGQFNTIGDVDTFAVDVDGNQLLTLRLTPQDASIQSQIEVLGGGANALAVAAAAGDTVLLQTVPVATDETVAIALTTLAGIGGYEVQAFLNTLLESETTSGIANDTIATAEDLLASAIPLQANGDRLAVLGTAEGAEDYYRFSLGAGQVASIALTGLDEPPLDLTLVDAGGTPLALGVDTATDVGALIDGFVAPVAGDYWVQIQGGTNTDYSLVVTRDAQFEAETNDTLANGQQLILTPVNASEFRGQALGARQISALVIEPDTFAPGTDLTTAFAGATLSIVTTDGVTPTGEVVQSQTTPLSSTGSRTFARNGTVTFSSGSQWLRADFTTPVSTVAIDVIGDDSNDPGILRAFAADGTLLQEVLGFNTPTGNPQTLSIDRDVEEIAYILAAGQGGQTAALDNLVTSGDLQDVYLLELADGDQIEILTTTPGDGAGEPVTSFDPNLSLFDSAGLLVGVDENSAPDGRNARIVYTVPNGGAGTYALSVAGTGQGDYTVQAIRTGTTALADPAPTVIATTPIEAAPLAGPPLTLDLVFSEGIRADSLTASDIVFTDPGVSIDGVTLVDGRTARFSLTVPNVDATYDYTLAAAAILDLQGQGNLAHTGSFQIDQTGPQVVNTVPATQVSSQFNQFTFVFNEAIDPASVDLSDIVQFMGPDGDLSGALSSITTVNDTITLQFTNQLTPGLYVLEIGPNLQDLAGNLLDQDGNGVPGEPTDTFTVQLQLQAPDLAVQLDSLPATAEFGSTIDVTYTVENIGADPALEQWRDRIYLSTDGVIDGDDILLATIPQTGDTLGPLGAFGALDDSYTRTETVTLPLDLSLTSGAFQILVQTDALAEQPEANEGNNLDSGAIALAFPPLADITVSDIAAPIEALSGQQIPITWTLTNQGTADFTGTLTDQIYLSTDTFFGGDQFFGNFDFTGTILAGQSINRTQNITLPITLEGDRYVILRTDVDNTFFEGPIGEANNTTVDDIAIDVSLAPFPNLQVTSVTAPITAFSGQEVAIEWVVTNTGTGSTSASGWRDQVWLSLDDQLDGNDIRLGSAPNPSFLGVGDSYLNTLTATLPQGIDDDYFFIVQTDSGNQVFEFENEADNLGVGGPTEVELTPPPDLQVTTVSAPSSAFSGQPTNVSWTVTNAGTGNTVANFWRDRIYLSTDNTFDSSDTLLSTVSHTGALVPTEAYTVDTSVTLPIGISGDFFFVVVTDPFNQVFESAFEGNNTGFDAIPTTVNLTPPPDLEVTVVDAPATGLAGRDLTINYTVTNFGATPTPNSNWLDRIYLSTDNVFDPSTDILFSSRTRFGALDIGASYSNTVTAALPNELSGDVFVFVATDTQNAVFELNNDNNINSDITPVAVTSATPDLVVTDFQAPIVGEIGQSILVDWSVQNQGIGDTIVATWSDQLVLSVDTVLGNNDDIILVNEPHTGLLDILDSYSVNNRVVPLPFSLNPGDYNLFINADRSNNVFEGTGETNNSSGPLPITLSVQSPDLQVTAVSTDPLALESEGELTVTWTVENFGAGATNATFWNDAVYLSPDATLGDGNDIFLGNRQRTNAVASGETYTTSQTFRLPQDLTGQFFAIVETDRTNRVVEPGLEENNDRAADAPVDITLRPVPDLVLTNVDAPANAFSGQTLDLSWTVRNDGAAATGDGNWFDTVYLSLDQIFDRNTDTFLGFTNRPNGLAIGEEYTQTASFNLPQGLSGPIYAFVAADSNNRIFERGVELNNVNYDLNAIQVDLTPPADLVVNDVTVPANGVPGQPITLAYTVTNQGTNTARGRWTDSVYLSEDGVWDINDPLIGRVTHTGDVPGGSSYSETLTAALPGVLPGNYNVIVRSDILNRIPEESETNNDGASLLQISVDAEELLLDTPDTDTLAEDQSVFYRVDVPANETLLVNLDSIADTGFNEVYVSFGDVPTRADFDFAAIEPFNPDQRVIVPATEAGTYFIRAFGNDVPNGPAAYEIEAELLEFSVFDETYGRGGNAGNLTIEINGAKFDRSVTARLTDGAGVNRPALNMFYSDQVTAFATFDLTGLAAGTYDVVVENGEGASLVVTDGLEVVNGGGSIILPQVDAPGAVRRNRGYNFEVSWGNSGLNDGVTPVFLVENTVPFGSRPGDTSLGRSHTFLGLNSEEGPPGILRPGQTESQTFFAFSDNQPGSYTVTVDRLFKDLETSFDLESFRESLQPPNLTDAEFEPIFNQLDLQLGTTTGDYLAVLSENATLIPPVLGRPDNIGALLDLELTQAQAAVGNSISGLLAANGLNIDVAGRTVIAINEDTAEEFTAITLNDGSFSLVGLSPGAYQFDVGLAPFTSPAPTNSLLAGEALSGVLLEIGTGATILGDVENATSEAVAEVVVGIFQGTDLIHAGITDADGAFELAGLDAGTYRLETFLPDGGGQLSQDITVTADEVATVSLSAAEPPLMSGLQAGGFSSSLQLQTVPFAVANTTAEEEEDRQSLIDEVTQNVLEGLGEVGDTFTTLLRETVEGVVDGLIDAGEMIASIPQAVLDIAVETARLTFLAGVEVVVSPAVQSGAYLVGTRSGGGFAGGDAAKAIYNQYFSASGPQSRVVYGPRSVVANSFKNNRITERNIDTLQADALQAIRDQFANQTLDCDHPRITREFTLDSLNLPSANLLEAIGGPADPGDWDFPFTVDLAGVLAGGNGQGGGPGSLLTPDQLPDTRSVGGEVFVIIPAGSSQAQVIFDLTVTIEDTIDFDPGNVGDMLVVQQILEGARLLERNGAAFDVPFSTTFSVDLEEFNFSVDVEDDCDDDDHDDEDDTDRPTSVDPNDILGPEGFGVQRWVAADTPLDYTIRFENDPIFATAPAQVVRITQQLDSDVDFRTFRVGDFGFGDLFVDVPDNRAFFTDRIDLIESRGIFVDVAASIDTATGEAFWEFTSIDPETGEIPENPLLGFLPPNLEPSVGEGFVNYSVRPSATAVTGDVVDAEARIVFDINEPIDTPPIFNTLDAGTPISTVAPLPTLVQDENGEFLVSWLGADDASGSGLASYDIYVSENNAPFTLWLDNTTLTEAIFVGTPGQTYGFYSVAQDNAGNSEPIPAVAQATTQIESSNELPILAQNGGLTVDEDAMVAIATPTLQVTDTDNPPAEIIYTITAVPANGDLRLDGIALAVNGTFTQADIDNNLLTYAHNGSETTTDDFRFTVSDGAGGMIGETVFGITVNPINDLPVLNTNTGLTLDEGATASIDTTLLDVTDADHDPVDLEYTLTAAPTHGALQRNGNALATNDTFTQADLNADLIDYAHDGSETTSDTFSFTVTDAAGATLPDTIFDISVNPVNEAPTALQVTNLQVTENAPADTLIGRLSTTDSDVGDSHTYELLDNAGGNFYITGNELRVAATNDLDFETDPDLDIRVRTTDAAGLVYEEDFTVNLTDDRDFDVMGTPGNDLIQSGFGGEVITGNGGQDTFIYDSIRDFGDIITDFNAVSDDTFDLRPWFNSLTAFPGFNLGTTPFDDYVVATATGAGTRIDVAPYANFAPTFRLPLATLENVNPSDIDATDFIFS